MAYREHFQRQHQTIAGEHCDSDASWRVREHCLDGQREALEAAINGAPLEASLGILVRTATEAVGQGARAGFYLANEEQTALHHVVGMPKDYAEAVDGFRVGPDSLACGLATATGQAILTTDVREDPLWQPWLWMAEKFDYRACWSFPIHSAGRKFIGTLAVYSRQPRQATRQDQQIGTLLARTASIIISRHKELEARRQAELALRDSEMRYKLLVEQTPDGIFVADKTGRYLDVSSAGCEMLGMARDEVLNCSFADVLEPDEQHRIESEFARFANGSVVRSEWRFRRKDQSVFVGEIVGRQLPDGRLQFIVRDITERRQAETTRQLLLNELNHRVKNTLATVQAIAQQTLVRTQNPADFVNSFGGRIHSLARVHAMLSTATWEGADLRELIRDQVLSGPVDETRLTAWGPTVRLDPQMALHLGLMLHELGTNSVKHGALSAPGGWVTVNWTTDDSLHLSWVEQGGPPVVAPSRRGFGSVLIKQSAQAQGGEALMRCEASGIIWTIELPLADRTSVSNAARQSLVAATLKVQAQDGAAQISLAGRRILIVEDEPLVGLDIVAGLESAHAQVEGPVGTPEKALETIEHTALDGVLLDANLRGRPVDEVASALVRRNIPFVFVTGHGRMGLPQAFRHVPVLSKPFTHQQLIEAAAELIDRRVVVHLRR